MILGADPEFFVQDKNGNVKSAIGLIGGKKDNPKYLFNTYNFKVLEDNVAIEYNIAPAQNESDFTEYIKATNKNIQQLYLTPNNYFICKKSSHIFDEKELDDPFAWIFGCEPDYNAYKSNEKLVKNPKPKA